MSFSISHLVAGRGAPISISADASAEHALDLMLTNDFSQLPVVDHDGKPVGLITYEMLARAAVALGVQITSLRVRDAAARPLLYRSDDDPFQMLEDLKANSAILVVDRDERLKGIVTSFDTNEFFRRRAEDLLLIEDIEETLKENARRLFGSPVGQPESTLLLSAIRDVTTDRGLRSRFEKAMAVLFPNPAQRPSKDVTSDALLKFAAEKELELHELTFQHLIDLFLHASNWPRLGPVFRLDRQAVRKLLEGVRDSRNKLAHFRGELTAREQGELRFCKEWLSAHEADLAAVCRPSEQPVPPEPPPTTGSIDPARVAQAEESAEESDSRYSALAAHLRRLPADQDAVTVDFSAIEQMIRGPLPPSAVQHRAWWANDTVGHVQSKQWLKAGWRVETVDRMARRVTFRRMRDLRAVTREVYESMAATLRENVPKIEVSDPSISDVVSAVWVSRSDLKLLTLLSFSVEGAFRVLFWLDPSSTEVAEAAHRFFTAPAFSKEMNEPGEVWRDGNNLTVGFQRLIEEDKRLPGPVAADLGRWAADLTRRFVPLAHTAMGDSAAP